MIGTCTQQMVSSMKDKVSSHEIVRRVTQSYSGSKYIEFKDVINSMLLSYQFDFWSLTATVGIHKSNLYWHQNQKNVERVCTVEVYILLIDRLLLLANVN